MAVNAARPVFQRGKRHDQRGELLGRTVERQHLMVENLADSADAVLGAGQFFAERLHRGVGLEVGVGHAHHHQPAKARTQHACRRRQRADGSHVGRAAAAPWA